uniref:Uncharacterized protein n=1 Tax=Oryza glumipatula TaxID=40148 RepID=A0A0E0AWX5_9ORYZ
MLVDEVGGRGRAASSRAQAGGSKQGAGRPAAGGGTRRRRGAAPGQWAKGGTAAAASSSTAAGQQQASRTADRGFEELRIPGKNQSMPAPVLTCMGLSFYLMALECDHGSSAHS